MSDDRNDLRYEVYTDGGADGNPGKGGYGVLIIDRKTGERMEYKQGYVKTTNNRMELSGAIRALEELSNTDGKILLRSDSQYVIKGITEWIKKWQVNNWKNSKKEPVENSDLWKKLNSLKEGMNIEFEWIKGHGGNPGNERCDDLSHEAREGDLIEDEGYVFIELKKLDYKLTVCKLISTEDINLNKDFYFIGRTDEEISLVCRTEDTPPITSEREDGWRGFRIQGVLDFSLIGILSEISGVLANNKIGIFAVSTYNTDYILVKEENFDRALNVLAQAGYKIV